MVIKKKLKHEVYISVPVMNKKFLSSRLILPVVNMHDSGNNF